jgi:hypothetical protein
MSTVDVGDEVKGKVVLGVVLQGLGDHNWAATYSQQGNPIKDKVSTYRSEPPMPMLMIVSIFFPL